MLPVRTPDLDDTYRGDHLPGVGNLPFRREDDGAILSVWTPTDADREALGDDEVRRAFDAVLGELAVEVRLYGEPIPPIAVMLRRDTGERLALGDGKPRVGVEQPLEVDVDAMTTDGIHVAALSVDELAAAIRNDTEAFPLAGRVEVPAALEELRRRAGELVDQDDALDQADAEAALRELDRDEREQASADAEAEALEHHAGDGKALDRPGDAQAPPPTSTDPTRALLELNGYNAIRTEVLSAVHGVAGVPVEAIDAAIDFARRSIARLEVSTNPDAGKALAAVRAELDYYRAARHFAKALGDLGQRHAARNALVAP